MNEFNLFSDDKMPNVLRWCWCLGPLSSNWYQKRRLNLTATFSSSFSSFSSFSSVSSFPSFPSFPSFSSFSSFPSFSCIFFWRGGGRLRVIFGAPSCVRSLKRGRNIQMWDTFWHEMPLKRLLLALEAAFCCTPFYRQFHRKLLKSNFEFSVAISHLFMFGKIFQSFLSVLFAPKESQQNLKIWNFTANFHQKLLKSSFELFNCKIKKEPNNNTANFTKKWLKSNSNILSGYLRFEIVELEESRKNLGKRISKMLENLWKISNDP